jgi:Asp-tRNAAsn/Glu-tRNAGln amidotransferase A subunit and related amidases
MTTDDSQSINRRTFMTTSLAAGALISTHPRPLFELSKRASAQSGALQNAGGPVEEKSITQLQEAMRSGVMTSRAITEAYRARIAEMDKDLRAVIELNPDALTIADAMDAERKNGKLRGPLHGIPILIKDNVGTADKMETTAGSLALVGARPPRDAFLVERLRAAGAVILGKTNLSEWANFRSTHSTSGWSGRGGQCRNPYALDRTPSGSSSGSAGGRGVELLRGSDRLGDQWLDREPVGDMLAGGNQADRGTREPERDHPDLAHAGHRGPNRAHRHRRGHSPRCSRGR